MKKKIVLFILLSKKYTLFFYTDIDTLLGEPIQKELELNTGIAVAFDNIVGVCSGNTIKFTLFNKII